MTNAWIPTPAAAIWTAVFVLIVAVHLWHAVRLAGRHRLWHLGHILMGAGMAVMFAPTAGMLVGPAAGVAVFAAAATVLTVVLLTARARGLALGPLWVPSVADLAWMAYMYAMMSATLRWLSLLGAAWFAAQAIGWAGGWLGRLLEHGGLGDPTPPTHDPGPLTTPASNPAPEAANTGERGGVEANARTETTQTAAAPAATQIVDGGIHDWSIRVTLTLMAAGMAYMILAMQFGQAPMAGMPGM